MRFDEYERTYFQRYQAFAEVVRHLLEKAILASGDLPRPQSFQSRAKTPSSLRKRLEETGSLDADVAATRRDLAGVRIIFYTNNDVERLLASRVVHENFEVDHDGTKIHHPIEENGQVRYQAIHYTVSLNDARTALAEYRDFVGMRCEIQIQTILIHAWAETSHDIIYKVDDREGFGNEALSAIRKRFDRIMDKYLIPAGYEFQRVQQDYERLVAGKELFDNRLLESLSTAGDNNARYELLSSLADDLLPLYDDLPSVFPEVVEVLVGVVEAARITSVKSIDGTFTRLPGFSSRDVVEKSIEIIDRYRYAAVKECFLALLRIYEDETDGEIQKRITEAVSHIAKYDLRAWEQVGPVVQEWIAELVTGRNWPDAVRPLLIEVWRHILDAEATGVEWSADAASFQTGAIPIGRVHELRQTALKELFKLFDSSTTDQERKAVFFAMENATRTSMHGEPTSDFFRQALMDHAAIIKFLSARTATISFEVRETIEHNALYSYYRAGDLEGERGAAMGCAHHAAELKRAINEMRERFDEDPVYVRYKTLVGFEGVMAQQWEDRSFQHRQVDAYRNAEIDRFVGEIDETNQSSWLVFLERCAATRSNDAATFPKFNRFITKLSNEKPSVAKYLLANGNEDLLRFLSCFLDGLIDCGDSVLYQETLLQFMAKPESLRSIAMHWIVSSPDDPEMLQILLDRAIEENDNYTVAQCASFAIRNYPDKIPPKDRFIRAALRHLIAKGEPGWVRLMWFEGSTRFFDDLQEADASLILESLLDLRELTWEAERILSRVAVSYPHLVWDFIGERLAHSPEDDRDGRYRAVPFRFHFLSDALSRVPDFALEKAREWFGNDEKMFSYRGGRALANVFPRCPRAFSDALVAFIERGDLDDARFVLAVMQNYQGQGTTHDVLRALIRKFPNEETVVQGVRRSIGANGVVHGERGFVESLRSKVALMELWLKDENPDVVAFARTHIAALERSMLSEQRSADSRIAMRKLEFDDLDGEGENE
ncbi:hypothetical protein ACC691_16965 [Rhizobium johnstonii]|uniref:hypothetical protein n=1 Tax=Rhizobium johnstonii TaxID=3019933 RepID=UPI003F98B5DC